MQCTRCVCHASASADSCRSVCRVHARCVSVVHLGYTQSTSRSASCSVHRVREAQSAFADSGRSVRGVHLRCTQGASLFVYVCDGDATLVGQCSASRVHTGCVTRCVHV